MRALYIDTGVWVAYVHESDPLHAKAVALVEGQPPVPRLSNELVLSESVTLLRRVLPAPRATAFGRDILEGRGATLVRSEASDWVEGLGLIDKFADQRVSFADAVSVSMVKRFKIEKVASFDRHFRILLPDREILGA